MPISDMDSDDEVYRKKKKKKSKAKDHDRERDRSRSRERKRSRSRDRNHSHSRERSRSRDRSRERDRDKEKKHKGKKHKDKSHKKSKSEKPAVPDLTPAEKFSIFKKQRESGKTEDSVVDDMFKDFIAAKLKEIETDSPDIPDKDKNSNNAADPVASSVEEMKKFLDTELNNISAPIKLEPEAEVTNKANTNETKTNLLKDYKDCQTINNGINTKMQCDIKTEPKSDVQLAGFYPTVVPKPISKPATVIGPMLPPTLTVKEEQKDETTLIMPEPQGFLKTDTKKTDADNKKSAFGFKNFGIKLSVLSTELIQSGAVHDKKGKRLEDGEVLSSSGSEGSNSTDTEPEVEDDVDDVDEDEVSGTGSINETDDESKSRKKKKKKKKGKHKKKRSKEKEKVKSEDMVVVVSDKPGEKRKVSLGSRSRSRSPKKSKQTTKERSKRSRSKDRSKRSRSKERSRRSKSRDRSKRSRSKEKSKRSRSKDRTRSSPSRTKKNRSRSRSRGRRSNSRSRKRSKDRSSRRDRSRSRDRKRSRSRSPIKSWRSSRYGDFDAYRFSSRRDRSRTKSPDRETEKLKEKERKRLEDLRVKIDKAKLREIAMKNALSAAKTGGVQLDVVIKAGGKSVQELTEYCKRIQDAEKAKRLARGEEVSSEEEFNLTADSDEESNVHHPFKMREPGAIVMDIRNARTLPIVSPQDRLVNSGQLRLTFPVSSGNQHRDKEWVPVEKTQLGLGQQLAIPAPEEVKVFEEPTPVSVDISSIVSERLNAVRKLQENPNDIIAKQILSQAQHKASQWASSKHLPGQFLGSTGANIMSQEELMGNKKRQAWIKKDVFKTAAPVTSGIGMYLLQKMGWKMGEGLGKNNEGLREPLMLDFKVDRKGLVTTGEGKKASKIPQVPKVPIAKDLSGKHPVSALGEFCNRRKWGAPKYELIHEGGPSHKRDFVYKVQVNGYWYQPSIASNNKKLAKAASATVCLQELGMVPRDVT